MSDDNRLPQRARAVLLALALLGVPALARAQGTLDNCPGHLFAIGSRLGWAEALAANAGPAQDAAMFAHMTAAGAHAQAANTECAQEPPPWPIFQNWRQLQGALAQMINEFQRGLMNRSQLAFRLASWQQGMGRDAAFRALGSDIRADATCDELYLRIGAALAYAQTTTQIRGGLANLAIRRLSEARSLVQTSTTLRPPCRNLSRLVADIDEAMRHPADNSTVTRVNDLWNTASLICRLGPAPVPPPPTPPSGNLRTCGFHFWATGSRLGWAEAIARAGPPDMDGVLFQHLAAAGQHVRAANETCAQQPPPFPPWQNWRDVQGQLDQIVNMYRRGLMNRSQLVNAIHGLRDALASQLMWRNLNGQVVQGRTCGELYVRIGGALGFAQTTTQIHRGLTPEAAEQLRQARQLIELARQLIPPCTDLEPLIALIDQALGQRSVASVDAVWRLGSEIMAPDAASWPPDQAPPPPPPPPPPRGLVATGGPDPADIARRNNRLLNEFRYQASSFEGSDVSLEIVPPAAAGQPYTARITGQVTFRRHLLHPLRPGRQFEEWWVITVTLGPGQGTLERLEGPASAIEDYRSVAPDRTNRLFFNNERWYALKQPDGTYRLTMPAISDGIPFILTVR